MCTVSFYKGNSKVIITSNRDENINRPLALPPTKITLEHSIVYCPLDPLHNGTWFVINHKGNVFVLLNGAEQKHTPNPRYRKSRGLILLDIINSNNFHKGWNLINLSNIEPFTIIAFVDDQLFQIRWNEMEKSLIQLETNKPYIWSSTTLYNEDIISKRERWFSEFLNQRNDDICSEDLISFHTNTQKNDNQNGLVMNRNNSMLTKNITQCEITEDRFTLTHFDLISQEKVNHYRNFDMKIWWHKFTNWEYWSVNIIYLPTFFLWIWYMMKFRSFSFYKYSNPGIKNGGFYGDSKKDIYSLLPKNLFPKTILIEQNKKYDFKNIIDENQLVFPLILKPDIGLRGIDVVKVISILEIENYCKIKKTNFLIQELIDLPNEIGLFYCRIPNENNGKITGLTLKNFLTVEGNGFETIEQLLKKNYRYKMQISKLKNKINLKEILPLNVKRCIVPFGNHNRGTEFLDGNAFISDKLEQSFNTILKTIPGFYYGRLDIRYNTFEELEKGLNFSIIELNGAKSEPTHIYDPKHSFWFGQMEIFRHQKIMQKIVKVNVQQLTAVLQKLG